MSYGWADHVGELELWMEAPSPEGVLAEGLRALGSLLAEHDGAAVPAEPMAREIALEGDDLPMLLADWLSELAFLAETEGFVPEAVDELTLVPGGLRARVQGRRGAPSHLVKAVTYHRLEFAPHAGRWRATALLDV